MIINFLTKILLKCHSMYQTSSIGGLEIDRKWMDLCDILPVANVCRLVNKMHLILWSLPPFPWQPWCFLYAFPSCKLLVLAYKPWCKNKSNRNANKGVLRCKSDTNQKRFGIANTMFSRRRMSWSFHFWWYERPQTCCQYDGCSNIRGKVSPFLYPLFKPENMLR